MAIEFRRVTPRTNPAGPNTLEELADEEDQDFPYGIVCRNYLRLYAVIWGLGNFAMRVELIDDSVIDDEIDAGRQLVMWLKRFAPKGVGAVNVALTRFLESADAIMQTPRETIGGAVLRDQMRVNSAGSLLRGALENSIDATAPLSNADNHFAYSAASAMLELMAAQSACEVYSEQLFDPEEAPATTAGPDDYANRGMVTLTEIVDEQITPTYAESMRAMLETGAKLNGGCHHIDRSYVNGGYKSAGVATLTRVVLASLLALGLGETFLLDEVTLAYGLEEMVDDVLKGIVPGPYDRIMDGISESANEFAYHAVDEPEEDETDDEFEQRRWTAEEDEEREQLDRYLAHIAAVLRELPSVTDVDYENGEFTITTREPARHIIEMIEAVGMFAAPELDELATVDDIHGHFSELRDYFRVYGERVPRMDWG